MSKYIQNQHTNFNEYCNSIEGLINLKITNASSDAGYDLIALYASAVANAGPVVDKLLLIELGIYKNIKLEGD